MQEKHLLGSVCEDRNAYDKIQIILIRMDDKSDNKEKNVISLLNIALGNDVSAEEKLELLKENFHIRTTEKLGKEVSNMCNYSEGILQKGIEKGRAEERKNSILY